MSPVDHQPTPAEIAADQNLILELKRRMPDASNLEIEQVFMSVRLSYGEHALEAIMDGAVVFERRENGS